MFPCGGIISSYRTGFFVPAAIPEWGVAALTWPVCLPWLCRIIGLRVGRAGAD